MSMAILVSSVMLLSLELLVGEFLLVFIECDNLLHEQIGLVLQLLFLVKVSICCLQSLMLRMRQWILVN